MIFKNVDNGSVYASVINVHFIAKTICQIAVKTNNDKNIIVATNIYLPFDKCNEKLYYSPLKLFQDENFKKKCPIFKVNMWPKLRYLQQSL